jgi:hypothetical protein
MYGGRDDTTGRNSKQLFTTYAIDKGRKIKIYL